MRGSSLHRLAVITVFGWAAFVAPPATAHAIIVEAHPAMDAVVQGKTVTIRLRFNSRIDRARSRLTLFGADGRETPVPLARNAAPDVLAAELAGLAPGAYRLRWQVLAVDGHITRGDIPFTVAAP